MKRVVGVQFRSAGKMYYFDPGELEIHFGDKVIVETAQGKEMGSVNFAPTDVDDEKVAGELKPVIRIATEEDKDRAAENRAKEWEAYQVCREKISEYELDMKLVKAEYNFERTKLLFYFTADGRVDFRELVKSLAAVFRTRIELRQIGVRDETRLLGGIGICGRELCCATYLNDFASVTIKMAKEQNLSLNPTKISGLCGRLMCCLKNEEEAYEYLNTVVPAVGDDVTVTATGEPGRVQSVNLLRKKVKVYFDEGDTRELREYEAEDLTFVPHKHKNKKKKNTNNNAQPVSSQTASKDKVVREALEAASLESDFVAEETEAAPVKESQGKDKPRDNRDNKHRKHHKDHNNNNSNNHGPKDKPAAEPGAEGDRKPKDKNHRHHNNKNRNKNRNHDERKEQPS